MQITALDSCYIYAHTRLMFNVSQSLSPSAVRTSARNTLCKQACAKQVRRKYVRISQWRMNAGST
jgi:hypothetical protein